MKLLNVEEEKHKTRAKKFQIKQIAGKKQRFLEVLITIAHQNLILFLFFNGIMLKPFINARVVFLIKLP